METEQHAPPFDLDRERRRKEPIPFEIEDARRRLPSFFAGYPEAQAAFLFGSRVHGRVRPSSDVDIAVWIHPATPQERRWELQSEWWLDVPDALEYPGDVDVVIANDAPPSLAWEIARRPVVLWEAGPDRAMKAAFRMRQYFRDELPYLERRRERLFASIARGDFGVRHPRR